MDFLKQAVYGNTKLRYMEVGFSEEEAEAMSWIAQQKAQGKFVGAASGLFLAVSWGHWHTRILSHFNFHFSQRFTQLGIIMLSILASDYFFTGRRRGANEFFGNRYWNTNLLNANIDSLIENFKIYPGKFDDFLVESFDLRLKLLKTPHNKIKNKKWVHNPELQSAEEFCSKILKTTQPYLVYQIKPSNIRQLIDETGQKLSIHMQLTNGWKPL